MSGENKAKSQKVLLKYPIRCAHIKISSTESFKLISNENIGRILLKECFRNVSYNRYSNTAFIPLL